MLKTQTKKNLTFWLIVTVCAAPVILAALTYYVFKPSKLLNYGELIEPPITFDTFAIEEISRPTTESALIDTNASVDAVTSLNALKGRWILAYIAQGDNCAEECRDNLYLTRQVRLMTGKNRFRVERMWITFQENSSIPDSDRGEFDGLWTFKTDINQTPFNAEPTFFVGLWIVDPLGRLIMKYPFGADPKKVYKPPITFDTFAIEEISRPTTESALIDTNASVDAVTSLNALKGRWILAYIAQGDNCAEECRDNLYLTRQVRLMTGKNRFRVERMWITFQENSSIPDSDRGEFDGLWTFKTDINQTPFNAEPTFFVGLWIVDPLGRLIMKYPFGADPKKVYKDLSRLLRASRIG